MYSDTPKQVPHRIKLSTDLCTVVMDHIYFTTVILSESGLQSLRSFSMIMLWQMRFAETGLISKFL